MRVDACIAHFRIRDIGTEFGVVERMAVPVLARAGVDSELHFEMDFVGIDGRHNGFDQVGFRGIVRLDRDCTALAELEQFRL